MFLGQLEKGHLRPGRFFSFDVSKGDDFRINTVLRQDLESSPGCSRVTG